MSPIEFFQFFTNLFGFKWLRNFVKNCRQLWISRLEFRQACKLLKEVDSQFKGFNAKLDILASQYRDAAAFIRTYRCEEEAKKKALDALENVDKYLVQVFFENEGCWFSAHSLREFLHGISYNQAIAGFKGQERTLPINMDDSKQKWKRGFVQLSLDHLTKAGLLESAEGMDRVNATMQKEFPKSYDDQTKVYALSQEVRAYADTNFMAAPMLLIPKIRD